MRILLTSDLHGNLSDYLWILEHASEFDLVCIAGDLIDAFDVRGASSQIELVVNWSKKMQRLGVPIALCSGNHDELNPRYDLQRSASFKITPEREDLISTLREKPYWLPLLSADTVAIDGETRSFGKAGDEVLVTCLPYDAVTDYGQPQPEKVWSEALSIHRRSDVPWLVLHHEPPMDCRVGGCYGSLWIAEKLVEASPTYLISGHIHDKPFQEDGAWMDRLEATWCFNPGRVERRPYGAPPNHIILDTWKATAVWHYWEEESGAMRKQIAHLRHPNL